MEVRRLMEETVGVVRDRPSLELAVRTLSRLAAGDLPSNGAVAGLLIAAAALQRAEVGVAIAAAIIRKRCRRCRHPPASRWPTSRRWPPRSIPSSPRRPPVLPP